MKWLRSGVINPRSKSVHILSVSWFIALLAWQFPYAMSLEFDHHHLLLRLLTDITISPLYGLFARDGGGGFKGHRIALREKKG